MRKKNNGCRRGFADEGATNGSENRNERPRKEIHDDVSSKRNGRDSCGAFRFSECSGGCVAGAGTMQPIKKSQGAVKIYATKANHKVATETEYVKELDKLVD